MLRFQPDEIMLLEQNLAADQTVTRVWGEYVDICHGKDCIAVSSFGELTNAVNSAVPGAVILVKGMFWYGVEIANQTICNRVSLEAVIRVRPELFGFDLPDNLMIRSVERLSEIPYFLDNVHDGNLTNLIVILFIDPDIYDSISEN